ncbi:MAG: LamG domain-containing protein [Desulfovibrionaceae bacterium]
MLVYLVLALAALGMLGVAMTSFFSASSRSTAHPDCSLMARYLAEAGTRYAMNQLRAASDVSLAQFNTTLATLQGTTYTLPEGSFSLNIVDASPSYTVTATGIACADADPATAQAGSVAFTINGTYCPGCGGGGDGTGIAFENGDTGQFEAVGEGSTSGGGNSAITVDPENGNISMGLYTPERFGCIWYKGNKGSCKDGVCPFRNGFRSYWVFELSKQAGGLNSYGDGFTFAMVSAETNLGTACGGSVGTSMGELLGYAGTGLSGVGIAPPKMAMEFDFFQNSGTGSVCKANSRVDPNCRDHCALVYWGRNVNSGNCDKSFDDNRHGEGLLTDEEPRNPGNWSQSGDGYDGVWYTTDDYFRSWNLYAQNGATRRFLIRMEVNRSTSPSPANTYCYNVRAWVKRDNEVLPAGFSDVSEDYYDPANTATAPDITDSFVLNQTWHDLFKNIYFGWTFGTGANSANMIMSDFKLDFEPAGSCSTTAVPQDYVSAWTMYEGSGATLHDLNATNHNNGAISDATWVGGVGCPACSALLTTQYNGGQVAVPTASSLNLDDHGTISAWVYLNGYVDWGGIVHKGDDSNFDDECYTLQFSQNYASFPSNKYTMSSNSVPDGQKRPIACIQDNHNRFVCATSDTRLSLQKWYHVAVTWDRPGNMTMYINGQAEDTVGVNRDPQTTSSPLTIGAQFKTTSWGYTSYQYPFNGIVDEVYLYKRALTATEIQALYNAGLNNR